MSARGPVRFKFCLYVAAGTQNSQAARSNLAAFCKEHLHDNCEIEIVDVLRDPERALEDGIYLTPTLIKLSPLPRVRVIGILNHARQLLDALTVDGAAA